MRTRSVYLRLSPPSFAGPTEVVLTEAEYTALEAAAAPESIGVFVKRLTHAAIHDVEDVHAQAKLAGERCGLGLGGYLRLLALATIGYASIAEDVARARSCLAKR